MTGPQHHENSREKRIHSQQRICFFSLAWATDNSRSQRIEALHSYPNPRIFPSSCRDDHFHVGIKLVALGWKWLIFTHLSAQLEAFSPQTFSFQPLVDVSGLAGTDIKSLYLGNMYGWGRGEEWPHLMRSSKSGHEVTKIIFFKQRLGWESHQNQKKHTQIFSHQQAFIGLFGLLCSFRPLKNTWESLKRTPLKMNECLPQKGTNFQMESRPFKHYSSGASC